MAKKKSLLIYMCLLLFFMALVYTLMIKFIDVGAIAPDKSSVGFSTINSYFRDLIGYHNTLYKVTKYSAIIPIGMVGGYGLYGLYQLIKNKSFAKVDKKLYVLAGFYVIFALVFFLFEKLAINVRPFMVEGKLEASYPSTHTMLAVSICGSSLLMLGYYIKNKKLLNILNILTWIVMIAMVVGRLMCGAHWMTDILGGIIISLFLLMVLYTVLYCLDKVEKVDIKS